MKLEELRGQTAQQLTQRLLELKREIMNLRFQKVAGELASSARFRSARREIARIKTIMNEAAKAQ